MSSPSVKKCIAIIMGRNPQNDAKTKRSMRCLLVAISALLSSVATGQSLPVDKPSHSTSSYINVKKYPTFIRGGSKNVPKNHSDPSSEIPLQSDGHEIVSEEVAYNRWRKIIQRTVKTPKGKVLDFDIVDQKGAGAVIIFAWCTKTKTATILREYNPGCHRVLHGLAAGIIETCPDKHDSDPELAARHELEEELHLSGGTWHRLTEEGCTVAMDKYNACMITAYLVLDADHVENPRPLDEEEDIEIVRGVSAAEILDMVRRGEFNIVGSFAALLAIEKLRELGEFPLTKG